MVSYTGTWMQNVGAGWLMTELSPSPLMVSPVQAAGADPHQDLVSLGLGRRYLAKLQHLGPARPGDDDRPHRWRFQ